VDSFAPTIVLRAILAVTGEYARVVLPRTAAKRSVDDNMVGLALAGCCECAACFLWNPEKMKRK
jgi:hypothetical protein